MSAVGLTALATLGALSSAVYAAALPAAGWLSVEPLAFHEIAFALVFGLYLAAIWTVRRETSSSPSAVALILGLGLLFRVLVLPTPVYLSSDVYRYLWDGRVQLAGINPYRYPPSAPELAALRDARIYPNINRPSARTVYPPAAQWIFALAAWVAPPSIGSWRLLLLASEVATIGLLLALLRRLGMPATAVLTYAWSPLVVYEGVQAGHLDLAVIPVLLLALTWRQAESSVRAGVTLGVAILMKLYPAVLIPVWWRPSDWRFPCAVASTVALGYLPYAASLGVGALGFLPQYLGRAEDHNIGLRAFVEWALGLTGEIERGVLIALFFGLLLAVLVAISRRRREDAPGLWRATSLAVGAYLLLVPTSMHPWYVLVMVPFLCASFSPGWLYFSGAVTLSYVKYLVEPAPFPWWVWVGQWVPLYALLIGVPYWSQTRPEGRRWPQS